LFEAQEVHAEDPGPLQVKQAVLHPTQMPVLEGLIVVPEAHWQ